MVTSAMSTPEHKTFEFGPFLLDTTERVLLRDGRPVPLTLKAFDVLLLLVENRGHIVEKDRLMNHVWGGSFVEESNLKVTVSRLRKALEDDHRGAPYIETVPRRGYRFLAGVNSAGAGSLDLVLSERTRATVTIDRAGIVTGQDRSRRLPFLLAGALLIVLVIVGGFFLLRNRTPSVVRSVSAAPIKSIAVLPFKPMVADSRDESLEVGMADTLITRLSGLKEIEVRPMSAVRKYAGLEQDAVAAGREQRVDAVLDGSLQRSGDRVRVTVKFLRMADGQTLWTERFDENFTDIFALQDRVAEQVAGLLVARLTEQEQMLLAKRNTDNPQAYEFYLKGNYSSGTEERLKKNIEFFQQAIKLDPGYALAYAGLADSYSKLANRGFLAPRESSPKAREALMKALEIDETLAEAHAVLATHKLSYEWDWPGAEREFKRAIELEPNNSGVHDRYGSYLQSRGRFDEALAEKKLGQKFDPKNFAVIATVGYTFFIARRYDEAIERYREAVELERNYSWGYVFLAEAYGQKGMYDEALAEVNKALSLAGYTRAIATLGYIYALAGRGDEARKVLGQLEELSKRKYVPAFFIATIHIGLGNKDQAFEWLEKAYQERNPNLVNLKVHPIFDPIRSDPRFANLLRKVGLSS
jgi:DNA-binding winged helix-turn-helix (wHTH) protein/TolB-like protein/Flp pilus assembly protein TadD